MKIANACQQCRTGKRRCQRLQAGGPCAQCIRRQTQCSHSSTKRRNGRLAPREIHVDYDQKFEPDITLSQETIEELVEHYIQFLHDRPHSLFHEPTLRDNVREKGISKALLYSICSLGSRFANAPNVSLLGPRLMAESKRLLQSNLENICLENIQTCILMANLCAAESASSSEALYFGIANRMADIMDLTTVDPADTLVLRETKNRVWWTLFMADRWCSSGLGLPRQINGSKRPVDLPMDEHIFHYTLVELWHPAAPRNPGLWAHMITLAEIFGHIQDLNRRLVQEFVREEDIERQVNDLARQLESWEGMLLAEMKLDEDNLQKFKMKGLGGAFVALHLGYHHYSTLLYFQYLDPMRPRTAKSKGYATRCKYHASSYSALLKLAREKGDCDAVYPTVGHMTLVSSAVLLHLLLFGDENGLTNVLSSLSANFEALLELAKYWPGLNRMIGRLFTFQNACLQSTESPTHRLDKWMLRFLLEHALPLEERTSSSLAESSSTTAEFLTLSCEAQKLQQHRHPG